MDTTDRADDEPVGVALFVDGPNVLREEFDVDLDDVRTAAEAEGPLVTTRCISMNTQLLGSFRRLRPAASRSLSRAGTST